MKRLLILVFSLILSQASWAHGDEDHGAAPHPEPVVQADASAESASSHFELLAEMEGETLTIYLNRYADNQPVSNAELEVESGAFKAKLKSVASGVYRVVAAPLAKEGEHALMVTLKAGEQSDLLDATLKVAAATPVIADEVQYKTVGLLIGLVGAGLLLFIWALRRRGGKKS